MTRPVDRLCRTLSDLNQGSIQLFAAVMSSAANDWCNMGYNRTEVFNVSKKASYVHHFSVRYTYRPRIQKKQIEIPAVGSFNQRDLTLASHECHQYLPCY